MSPEALVLGLLSAVRTVPLALVYAFLLDAHPRRLLVAYVGAGLVMSFGVGLLALLIFEPTSGTSEASTGRLVVDLVLGALALVAAVVSRAERFQRPSSGGPGPLPGKLGDRVRHPTAPTAALAGATTNLPGLYYLAGLVAILATNPTPVGGAVQVVVYNVLRFAAPLLALALVVFRPDRTMSVVRGVQAWGVRNRRNLLSGVLVVVGIYLVVKGLVGLLG